MANPNWKPGISGNPSGRPKGKSIGKWLMELGRIEKDGKPRNQIIAELLLEAAENKTISDKARLEIAKFITELEDGKPSQTSINANMDIENPFADIDSATLDRLREKIKEVKGE